MPNALSRTIPAAIVLPFIPISDRLLRPIGSGQHFEYVWPHICRPHKWTHIQTLRPSSHEYDSTLFLCSRLRLNKFQRIYRQIYAFLPLRDRPKTKTKRFSDRELENSPTLAMNDDLSDCVYRENYWYRQKRNKYWFFSPKSLRMPSSPSPSAQPLFQSSLSPSNTQSMINFSPKIYSSLCECHLFIRSPLIHTNILWLIFQSIARKTCEAINNFSIFISQVFVSVGEKEIFGSAYRYSKNTFSMYLWPKTIGK